MRLIKELSKYAELIGADVSKRVNGDIIITKGAEKITIISELDTFETDEM